MTANDFCMSLSSSLPFDWIWIWRLNNFQDEFEIVFSLFDTNFSRYLSNSHGSYSPYFRQRITKSYSYSCDDDSEVRKKIIRISNQLNNASNNLASSSFQLRAAAPHAVVKDRNDHWQRRWINVMIEASFQKNVNSLRWFFKRILQGFNQYVNTLRYLWIFDSFSDKVKSFWSFFSYCWMSIAETSW